MASGKVRVAILGTVGKAVFIDPNANRGATIGTDLRLPDGSVPSLRRLAEIICSYCDPVEPAPIIWKYVYEIPDNLRQIADLDCCGIIVRDCTAGEDQEVYDDTLEPEVILSYPAWEAPAKQENLPLQFSLGREAVGYRQQAIDRGTAQAPVVTTIDGTRYFRRWQRLIDENGAVSGEASALHPTINNSTSVRISEAKGSGWLHATSQNGVGTTGDISAWVVNGVIGNRPINPALGTDTYASHSLPLYAPGHGVFAFQKSNTDTGQYSVLALFPCSVDASPPSNPTRYYKWPDGTGAFTRRIIGSDEGHVYVYDNEDIVRFTADLTERTVLTSISELPDLPGEALLNKVESSLLTCGRYFGMNVTTAVFADNDIKLWDVSVPGSPTKVGSFPIDGGTNLNYVIDSNTAHLQGANKIWQVCPGDIVIPAAGTVWRCMELQAAGGAESRITIENPRAQGADPIFDLREVEQAEGGTPQAITVDAWGRVVESRELTSEDIEAIGISTKSRFPLVTGEVPPRLVYLDDGSLVYIEV